MKPCTIRWQISAEADNRYAAHFGEQASASAVDELRFRLRPLREQWEARGPGLLVAILNQLPWLRFPEQADVHLVRPLRGGGCLLLEERMYFEAMLANAHPQLPEVLRLAWLLARYAARDFLGDVDEQRLGAALTPIVLRGGEQVELARCDVDTLHLCLRAWHLADAAGRDVAARLLDQAEAQPSTSPAAWWAATLETFEW